jgi:hypothetical protein
MRRFVLGWKMLGLERSLGSRNTTSDTRSANTPSAPILKNPTTGIAACCARAAIGHTTAEPPTNEMKSRRLV